MLRESIGTLANGSARQKHTIHTHTHTRGGGGGGGGGGGEKEENILYLRGYALAYMLFYIQPSPKQGTSLYLIIHVHIF